MLLFLIGLQDPVATPESKPPVVRKLRAKATGSYAVELTSIGTEIARYSYTMRFTVAKGDEGAVDFPVDFVLADLTRTIDEREEKTAKFGAVRVKLDPTGFPKELTFFDKALPFSMPFISMYLPEKGGETVEFKSPMYDGAIQAVGKAFVKTGKELRVDLQANFHIAGEEKDQSMFRKYRSTAYFDPADGRLLRSEGKYVAPDGTVNFRVKLIS